MPKTSGKPSQAPKTNGRTTKGGPSPAVEALLYQVLETELGGVQVYKTALRCAENDDLRAEWQQYLSQTERHVGVARMLLVAFGLDPDVDVPARIPVRTIGQSLVMAMEQALASGDPVAAQLTAADCVVEAETKDHHNWELVGRLAGKTKGEQGKRLQAAYDEVEEDEDHHVYHSTGWARELWIEALGLPAILPPPEEEKDVDSALAAARAVIERDGREVS